MASGSARLAAAAALLLPPPAAVGVPPLLPCSLPAAMGAAAAEEAEEVVKGALLLPVGSCVEAEWLVVPVPVSRLVPEGRPDAAMACAAAASPCVCRTTSRYFVRRESSTGSVLGAGAASGRVGLPSTGACCCCCMGCCMECCRWSSGAYLPPLPAG